MISVIIYGRNDSHGYNLHKRAVIFFNTLAELLTHPDDEIVFADCNTPEGLPTFPEVLQDILTPAARARIRVIRIPAPSFRERFPNSKLPALEAFSRNVALRRTRPENPWVLSTNSDLVFIPKHAGRSLSELAARLAPHHYLLPRYNIPEWLWESLDRTRVEECNRNIAEWAVRFHLKEICRHKTDIGFDSCGDFQLVPRSTLFNIQGFDEAMRLGWHVDANLARRLFLHGGPPRSLEEELEGYHLNHNLQANLLHAAEVEFNDFTRFYDNCQEAELPLQRDSWGLQGVHLEEIRLPSRRFAAFRHALGQALPRPAGPPVVCDGSSDTFNSNLFYATERVVPYLANFIAALEPGTRIAYFGVHGELVAALHRFLSASEHPHQLLVSREMCRLSLEMEQKGEALALDELEERADLFVIDVFLGDFIPSPPPERLQEVLQEHRLQLYAQAVLMAVRELSRREVKRLQQHRFPRRFIFLGHQGTEFEGYLTQDFRFTLGPFNDHVHFAMARDKAEAGSENQGQADGAAQTETPDAVKAPVAVPTWKPVPTAKTLGFNVIGYFTGNFGLGMSGRVTVHLLQALGYPVACLDIDAGSQRSKQEACPEIPLWDPAQPMPYSINLFQMNPIEVGGLLKQGHPALRMGGAMNVIVPFWELSRIPGNWLPVLESMDLILAPTRFVQDAIVASVNGTPVRFYEQMIEIPEQPAATPRGRFELPEDALIFGFAFDFTSVIERKNPLGVIEAFLNAFRGRSDVLLVLKMNNAHSAAMHAETARRIQQLGEQHPNLRFINRSLSYAEVLELTQCWDVYVSLHRAEGLGNGLMESMSFGKVAMATAWSGNMEFMNENNSVLVGHRMVGVQKDSLYNFCLNGETDHVWAEPDLEDASLWMRRLAEDPELRRRLGAQAESDMRARRARVRLGETFALVERFHEHWNYRRNLTAGPTIPGARSAAMRVLFQNRISANAAPGGDTVVMDRYRSYLQTRGVHVDTIHDATADPAQYDLVHLYNLVLPKTIEPLARRVQESGVPFVVQAFQENQSFYLGRSITLYRLLLAYMQKNQDKALLPRYLELMKLAESLPTDTSAFAANHARAVICTSGEERDFLLSLHPAAQALVCMHGAQVSPEEVGPELFEKAHGLRDFVLCVGRLEARKNQLALLAALEDDDIPVVLADGGVCYSPDYSNICRVFRRKGRTLYTGRLSPRMLISAYRAAKVHVLPSWYELPGLVTLEAALYGCNVAASPHGGIREYLGDTCLYFEPEDLPGMRRAVLQALEAPKTGAAAQAARPFTWEKSGEKIYRLYQDILAGKSAVSGAQPTPEFSLAH